MFLTLLCQEQRHNELRIADSFRLKGKLRVLVEEDGRLNAVYLDQHQARTLASCLVRWADQGA